jgi:uncharacterized protein (TIGR03905 family)
MHKTYYPKGICATKIEFDVEDNKIHNLVVTNGCNGNLKGIAALVEGQDIKDVKEKLSGIRCGFKNTSCPDQLSKAIEEIINKNE